MCCLVFLKQKSLGARIGRGLRHCRDVAGVITVMLLERRARIVVCRAIILGFGERDHSPNIIANLLLVELAAVMFQPRYLPTGARLYPLGTADTSGLQMEPLRLPFGESL